MELRRITIEDIYPDEKNPRKDFGDIKALAESFELNALNPGEPINPIVVVQDGGIYRIVDGERRYKAMLKTKVTTCNAIVCEDMDEASTQIAMLTTDDKEKLTDLERSHGVQQMLLLGVDPVVIEKSARMKPGTASKIATVRALVDDAAEDMTLDRMLAIEEFADDPEAVEELTNCTEKEWESVATLFRRKRKELTQWTELLKACNDYDFSVVDKRDKEYSRYIGWADTPDKLESLTVNENINDGDIVQAEKSMFRVGINLYTIPSEDEIVDPEKETRKQRIHEIEETIKASEIKRDTFFFEHIDDLDSIAHIMDLVEASFFHYNGGMIDKVISSVNDELEIEIDTSPNELTAALGYHWMNLGISYYYAENLVDGDLSFRNPKNLRNHLRLMDAFNADGYQPDHGETVVIDLCKAILEKEDNDGED